MKIAVCFFGQVRDLEQNSSNILGELIDKFDTDVFVHTWTDPFLRERTY